MLKLNAMEDLYIKKTAKSPEIDFKTNGQLRISGVSILEDSTKFYQKPIKWIDEYILEPADVTKIDIDLDFFNTSSQVNIFEILLKLANMKHSGYKVEFYWHWEDEDFREVGEDISNLIGVDFTFIKKDVD